MALSFSGSANVNVGSATVLDNVNTGSCLTWCYPTGGGAIFRKGTATGARLVLRRDTTSSWVFERARATTACLAGATDANLPTAGKNKWSFVSAVWNTSGANGDQHLYCGDRTTLAAEATTYTSQQVGTGAEGDNAADDMFLGNNAGGTQVWAGRIAIVQLLNRALTLGEVRAWQFRPTWLPNTVGLWRLGWNGTINVPDLSGHANTGTITGATVSDDVPLGAWNGAQVIPMPSIAAAAAATSSGWPDRRRRAISVAKYLDLA